MISSPNCFLDTELTALCPLDSLRIVEMLFHSMKNFLKVGDENLEHRRSCLFSMFQSLVNVQLTNYQYQTHRLSLVVNYYQ